MNIDIKHLSKSYHDKTVLSIDDLCINSGSFLGIIGPNGAGKSTFAKIIAGLDQPTTGTIQYDALSPTAGIYQKITMVFQKPYLLRASVFDNIAYPLKIRKLSKDIITMKVNNILEEMDIQHIKDQNARTLSGGEAQKVALSRAIIFEPSLLILDEPTANIDPASTLTMEKNIKNFHKKTKATIIIVTHNLQQARRLCQDVIFMHQGSIIEQSPVEDIILNSKNPLTQKFVKGEIIL